MPKRVLIASQDLHMREMIRACLEQRTEVKICAQAANGREACEAAIVLRPDLLVLDSAMSDLSGIEVAGLLKKSLPEAKIILFSLHAEHIGKSLASAAGVDVVLAKPEGIPTLPSVVESLLCRSGRKQEY